MRALRKVVGGEVALSLAAALVPGPHPDCCAGWLRAAAWGGGVLAVLDRRAAHQQLVGRCPEPSFPDLPAHRASAPAPPLKWWCNCRLCRQASRPGWWSRATKPCWRAPPLRRPGARPPCCWWCGRALPSPCNASAPCSSCCRPRWAGQPLHLSAAEASAAARAGGSDRRALRRVAAVQ